MTSSTTQQCALKESSHCTTEPTHQSHAYQAFSKCRPKCPSFTSFSVEVSKSHRSTKPIFPMDSSMFWPWQHKNLEFRSFSLVIKAVSRLPLQFSCPMISLQWPNSMKDCFITLWQLNFPLMFFYMNFPEDKKFFLERKMHDYSRKAQDE